MFHLSLSRFEIGLRGGDPSFQFSHFETDRLFQESLQARDRRSLVGKGTLAGEMSLLVALVGDSAALPERLKPVANIFG